MPKILLRRWERSVSPHDDVVDPEPGVVEVAVGPLDAQRRAAGAAAQIHQEEVESRLSHHEELLLQPGRAAQPAVLGGDRAPGGGAEGDAAVHGGQLLAGPPVQLEEVPGARPTYIKECAARNPVVDAAAERPGHRPAAELEATAGDVPDP